MRRRRANICRPSWSSPCRPPHSLNQYNARTDVMQPAPSALRLAPDACPDAHTAQFSGGASPYARVVPTLGFPHAYGEVETRWRLHQGLPSEHVYKRPPFICRSPHCACKQQRVLRTRAPCHCRRRRRRRRPGAVRPQTRPSEPTPPLCLRRAGDRVRIPFSTGLPSSVCAEMKRPFQPELK